MSAVTAKTPLRRIQRWMLAGLLALVPAAAGVAQSTLVDTGQGSASGGYSLFNSTSPPGFNFLACKFTQASAFSIGTVQPWMVRPSGTIVVKLCANNGGNLPGTVLASQSFATSFAGFNAQWTSFIVSGAGWSQAAGTYWICFEPTLGTNSGSMPGNAPNPLSATAYFTDGNPGYVLNGAGDALGRFGLRLFTPAPPTPINVPADEPTIQDAIDAASQPSQEIIVAPGTYTEALNFSGKTIIVRSSGGAATTIIDASSASTSAVKIGSGSASGTRLEGFTITGGSTAGEGGGVLIEGATATVKDCVITGNTADSGGGAAVESSAIATFQNCAFDGNTGETLGGGAYLNGATASFTDCTFTGNSADADAGGLNVNNNGLATLTDCDFTGNQAGNGGGAIVVIGSGANAVIGSTTFNDNTALQAGAVMVNSAAAAFTDCDFINNHATIVGATGGGGLQVQGSSTVTVADSAFIGNDAAYGGGAQFLAFTGTATITGCDFENNAAGISGGGYHRGFGGGGTPGIGTTSFCGNTPDNVVGAYTNNGGNTLTCPVTGDVNGDGQVNVSDLLSVISTWGACPAPPKGCPSDVNHDGQVNVADLLLVITNWG